MKRPMVIAAMLLAAPSVIASSVEHGPGAFVSSLYQHYSRSDAPSPLGKEADKIFAPALLSKIRADQTAHPGESGKLDHDPLCHCQDADGLKLVGVSVTAMPSHKAAAVVRFRLGSVDKSVRLRLTQTSAGWRVADVSTANMLSLRNFLASPR